MWEVLTELEVAAHTSSTARKRERGEQERWAQLTASCFDSVLPWTTGSDATHRWDESVPFNWPNPETPPQTCPEVCFHGDFKFHQI